jgi:hypothetical protein
MGTHFKGPVTSTNGFVGSLTTADPLLATGLTVGSGTQITKILRGTVSVNPASLNGTTAADTSVTISGAATGDTVIMNAPTAGLTAGMFIVGAWVSATDTVKVRLYNSTGAPIDEAAANWSYCLIRS